MNEGIANIIRDRIVELPFVDKISGLVRTLAYTDSNDKGKVRKSYPISCDVCFDDCMKDGKKKLYDLIPDSSKRSVIYFEDNGVRSVGAQGNLQNFESSLRLVGWLNMAKLGRNDCSITPAVIASILAAVPVTYLNSNPLVRVKIDPGTIEPKTPAIFSRYTYDETVTQYLLHPYDYFAINFVTKFSVARACVEDFQVNGSDVCS